MSHPSLFFETLKTLADPAYQRFTCKLTPNVPPERILGVRIPALKTLAKKLVKEQPNEVAAFCADLPHGYYDENNLQGLLIAEGKDFDAVISALDAFLPYVDNWATCDIISPKVFKKNKKALLPHIWRWMASKETYTLRFGIEMLMSHFLDEDFKPEYLAQVADVRHDDYYVHMMVAWFFATALTKQYDDALPYIANRKLDPKTHLKAIQKARESLKIPKERKEHLATLR